MSTLKVTNIEHASTANGGIQLDNAGHVTIDGQQMPTVGPLSNRNLVAQRGTANVTSVGYQTVDRFFTSAAGGTFSQERIDLTSSDSPFSLGFRHAYRTKNSAVASATNHYRQFETRIEAQDVIKSGWNYNSTSSYITVSFWARASVAGTYTFDFRTQDSPAQAYATSITLAANTWKKFELTYPGDSALVIADDSGVGLRLVWGVYFATNFTASSATMNQWHTFSSTNISPDDTAGWGTTLNATFDVTGVQLEVGEKATPFEHRNFGDELARCMRYYETGVCFGMYKTSDDTFGWTQYSVQKRENPGVEINPPGSNPNTNQAYYHSTSSSDRGNRSINEINPSGQVNGQSNFKNGFIATMGGFTPASTNDAMWTGNYIADAEL